MILKPNLDPKGGTIRAPESEILLQTPEQLTQVSGYAGRKLGWMICFTIYTFQIT